MLKRSPLQAQQGFTLIETLLAAVLAAIVLGAVMAPVIAASRSQVRTANYSYAQEMERAGLNEMVSQVREATEIIGDGPNYVEMVTAGCPPNGCQNTAEHVYYECDIPQTGTSYNECLRVECQFTPPAAPCVLPSLSGGTVVIKNLMNGTSTDPVFSWAPSSIAPYYMTATIKVPASAGRHYGLSNQVVFSDGALMQNLNIDN
jgi:prepilin-type N-terminal cleavage/methylation domain-containing protein